MRLAISGLMLLVMLPAVLAAADLPVVIKEVPARTAEPPAPVISDRSWPQTVNSTVISPVFYDLDGDGTLDVIVGDDYNIRVYDHTGAPRPGWPLPLSYPMMHAAVGDVDEDGAPEIFMGSSFPVPRLNGFEKNGTAMSGWPAALPYVTLANTTCPVIADIDGDTHPDVGIASERGVSFFDADGQPLPGWPYLWAVPINNPQWSAPAVGDVDLDGELEVAVGTVSYPNWGVHLIRADGTAMPGWPVVTAPMYSSPALADLDGDGDLEIIAQEGDPGSQGHRLWVWHHDATVATGWPRNIAAEGQSSRTNPAIGDVDDNGVLEIVTATSDGVLHVLEPDGSYFPGFPRPLGVHIISSPTLIDVDADGQEEIFLSYWQTNTQYAGGWSLDGSPLPGFPMAIMTGTDLASHSSIHLADAEGDGDLDLTVSAASFASGRIWVLEVGGSIYEPGVTREDWPKIRRDAANRGAFPASDMTPVWTPDVIALALAPNHPNPFNPRTTLSFTLGRSGPARLTIYDVSGRLVDVLIDGTLAAGNHVVVWNGRDLAGRSLPSGTYLCRLDSSGRHLARSLTLLR